MVNLSRSSWDEKLVSKETRSLDNTISMYNLVHVCVFCSQYFDPDFPDGIAYPVKVPAKVVSMNIMVDVSKQFINFCLHVERRGNQRLFPHNYYFDSISIRMPTARPIL
jgi:hypothetical protein